MSYHLCKRISIAREFWYASGKTESKVFQAALKNWYHSTFWNHQAQSLIPQIVEHFLGRERYNFGKSNLKTYYFELDSLAIYLLPESCLLLCANKSIFVFTNDWSCEFPFLSATFCSGCFSSSSIPEGVKFSDILFFSLIVLPSDINSIKLWSVAGKSLSLESLLSSLSFFALRSLSNWKSQLLHLVA